MGTKEYKKKNQISTGGFFDLVGKWNAREICALQGREGQRENSGE